MPLQHWLQLSLTQGIGPILARRIIEATGSAQLACAASADLLATIEGIGIAKSRKIATALRSAAADAQNEMARAAAVGVKIYCPDDASYPLMLRSIPDPPNVLYCRGTLEDRDLNGMAIVGSRKCSFYGREQAERFGALLAGAGFTVISGGARGIDSAAHRGAMSHPQGRTIAVLGSGVDVPYPPENKELFEQVAAYGAVLSEFPLGTSPARENFPRRNRIVSGLSRGVLIIEADVRSGALITARQACDDHGRPVFALPGRVDNPLSAGPHLLIRDGATLVTRLEEIQEGLGPLPADAVEAGLFVESAPPASALPPGEAAVVANQPTLPFDGLTVRQRTILEAVTGGPTHVELIVERTGLEIHVILQELTFLSLKGKVRRVEGQTYERR
ncbi:MAG TPA: DNA-processing protein DprA [Tepidisphaeraceae bacterium]|jgi:DNA processing protein|nr:DNA-processing protein DprA [Tepidisphaeraceae bacterium]